MVAFVVRNTFIDVVEEEEEDPLSRQKFRSAPHLGKCGPRALFPEQPINAPFAGADPEATPAACPSPPSHHAELGFVVMDSHAEVLDVHEEEEPTPNPEKDEYAATIYEASTGFLPLCDVQHLGLAGEHFALDGQGDLMACDPAVVLEPPLNRRRRRQQPSWLLDQCPKEDIELPVFGLKHHFHHDASTSGSLSADARHFTKDEKFHGRLTVLSEARIRSRGTHRYAVRFTGGHLSNADGIGFVFSGQLPCTKNIQRIVSVFVNKKGRICFRVHSDVVQCSSSIKPFEVGDIIGLAVNLEEQVASFTLVPCSGAPPSFVSFSYGAMLEHCARNIKCSSGHLACVMKNSGVSISLYS